MYAATCPLKSLIIVASGEGGGGRQNPTKDNSAPPPLSVINIVKHCGVGGEGGIGGAPKSYKR